MQFKKDSDFSVQFYCANSYSFKHLRLTPGRDGARSKNLGGGRA